MARLVELNQTQANTNRIMGTFGYMAPEYAARGKFSVKSDVFSFGVLVLEIISGRRNLADVSREDYEMLICQAWTNWREGNISDIVEPAVSSGYSANVLRCTHISLLCVQEKAENRPEMISVIRWLDHHSITLSVPTQPAFFTGTSSRTRTIEASCSRIYAVTSSINGASISELYPR
ncbi:hypothetical protein MLD38_036895 [Melastoma candidum]|uniref:Uncharacterized protein n=1 Tax=Melastoma candidum TaxID=119954 RepID=A0ACB9LL56_9MYRT|nr:hypothetical protein MLD38_036895 [Melastoma candidum]